MNIKETNKKFQKCLKRVLKRFKKIHETHTKNEQKKDLRSKPFFGFLNS